MEAGSRSVGTGPARASRASVSLPFLPRGGEQGMGRGSQARPSSCALCLVCTQPCEVSALAGTPRCGGGPGAWLCLPISIPVLMGAAIPRFQVLSILVKKCFLSQRRWCLWEPPRSRPALKQSCKNRTLRRRGRRTRLKELGAGGA